MAAKRPSSDIEFPVWLVRDSGAFERRFTSLDDAGFYIEWMNEERPELAGCNWPGEGEWNWTGFVILDDSGRRMHLRVEESTVVESRLVNEVATLEDLDLLERGQSDFREYEAIRRLPFWKKTILALRGLVGNREGR